MAKNRLLHFECNGEVGTTYQSRMLFESSLDPIKVQRAREGAFEKAGLVIKFLRVGLPLVLLTAVFGDGTVHSFPNNAEIMTSANQSSLEQPKEIQSIMCKAASA